MTSFPDRMKAYARQSLEAAKYMAAHLSLESRLLYLASHLPQMLPFPFSGVIATKAGNGAVIEACHCPHQAEFTTDQTFNCLSIGKLFTATAVMQLIEEGKFSLKTSLAELLTEEELDLLLRPPYLDEKPDQKSLKELKKYAKNIRVEHLLSHRAGFFKKEGSPNASWDRNRIGEECYSNYGYQLLAQIIGKYTDSRNPLVDYQIGFRSHIEQRIFKPAHMEGAIRELHSAAASRPACFEISKEGMSKRVEKPEPYPHGNGCWRMTAADLLAFQRAIEQNHLLISRETFNTMINERLGFWVDRDEQGALLGYGHPGSGAGMSSLLYTWCQSTPITVAILSNYSGCEMVKPCLDPLILHS